MNNWDLDELWDESVDSDINPEIAVIRGIEEGFSPSGYASGLAYKNNYWGIGCQTDDLNDCTTFDSFREGVHYFYWHTAVGSANTCSEMMDSYSEIGTWRGWVCREVIGDTSLGVNYYDFLSEKRAQEVRDICDSGETAPATEEDEEAYTKFLCARMCAHHNNLFVGY